MGFGYTLTGKAEEMRIRGNRVYYGPRVYKIFMVRMLLN